MHKKHGVSIEVLVDIAEHLIKETNIEMMEILNNEQYLLKNNSYRKKRPG